MIDITTEQVVSLADAVRYVPRRNGRKIHISTIFRWTTRGVRGHKLATIQCGNTRCTSVEKLQAFFNRLSGSLIEAPPAPTARQRKREYSAAAKELIAAGFDVPELE